jgi:ribose transport system permease protein
MQASEAARSTMRVLARPAALAPLTIVGGIVVLLVAGGVLAPGFMALSNILLLLSLSAYLGIAAIGQTVVILTGGIDLSIAWTITGASIVFTSVTQGDDAHLWAGLAAALAVGIGAGFLNGVGVAKLKISPIVMTLGMNNVMQGLTLIYSQGTPSGSAPDSVKWIATGWVGGAPVVVLVWIGLGVIVSIGLHATRGGRYLYGVGESSVVSRLSGVDNDWVIIAAYTISGLSAAVTGVLFTGFSTMAFLGMGDQFVLPAIAAVVLGGASIYGGGGTYAGTFVGAVFLTVLTTVLTIVNISIGYRNIIYGLVIIAAVLLYRAYSRERE